MAETHARARERWRALALGTLLAAGAGFALLRALREPGQVRLVDTSLGEEAARISRALEPRGLRLPESEAAANATVVRRVITTEELERVIGMGFGDAGSMQYDERLVYRYRPHLREEFAWPEYPGGHWTRVTNGEGAREDHEFPDPAPDDFVLVAGDSHTEGLCENAKSFSNVLEAALAAAHPDRRIEVYNTGVSGYTFYNYLGALETHLPRKPEVFVSVFYAGNDFVEVTKLQHLFAGTVPPPHSPDYSKRMRAARALSTTALTQGLNQILYFRDNPDQTDLALRAAFTATAEIQRICREHGIAWIAVYIPAVFDLPHPEWAELRAQVKELLGLDESDLETDNRLGDRLLATLRERGVQVLDLRETFRAQTEPLYWEDLHINLQGQQVVADALRPLVEELLARQMMRR